MNELFLTIVNMSISASWIVLAVLLLRLLFKKAPKWITVLLWGIVAIRLICPFSIESVMSLIPSAETINPEIMMDKTPEINSGVPIINDVVNLVIEESFAPDPTTGGNALQIWIPILSFVWILGIAGMLLYTIISYLRIKRKIDTAVLLRDNIFQSENIASPFVLGIIKPKIYLPFNTNNKDMDHVIAHEQAHIRRKDHLWKPLGFLILTLHWFNPMMWLGYVLLCRDIELACDERVIKELDIEQKADYSQALLTCSVNRRRIAACPLAFGEVDIKDRVKSVLNYKRPAFWIILVSIILSAVLAVCFLTNPTTNLNKETSLFIEEQIIAHHHGGYKEGEFYCTDFKVLGKTKDNENTTVYLWVLYLEYNEENGKAKNVSGSHIPTVITIKKSDLDSQYELVEYWEPRDGSYYFGDICEKFPWYLQRKALDAVRYIKAQQANCDKKATQHFAFNKLSRTYEVTEVLYDDEMYSFSVIAGENSPIYEITEDMQLFSQKEYGQEGHWTKLGKLEKTELTKKTFDNLFRSKGWKEGLRANRIRKDNVNAWRLIYNQDILYYVLQQKNGELYLAYGSYDHSEKDNIPSDDTSIRRLYKLDKGTDPQTDGADGANVKTFESTVSYANWAEDSEINLGALNADKLAIGNVQHLPIYKFDTLNDMEQFKQSFCDTFTMDSGWDEVPSFNTSTATYDRSFFEDNSLLLIYVSANNSTHRFRVHSVRYDAKSFCVHIVETTNAESVNTAMAGWFVTVAVSDDLIKNCTVFDADLNDRIKLLDG